MVEVTGSLRVRIDGVTGRLVASGGELRWEVGRATDLLRPGGWRTLRMVARLLDRSGLTLRVVHRERVLLTLGRGLGSRVVRGALGLDRSPSGRRGPTTPE